MNNIKIVIDSNYGDSGKGLITDYLCSKSDIKSGEVAVCRFCGSSNAGHTVRLNKEPESLRHVFNHFGSGSLRGVPTILYKDFLVNPEMFFSEAYELNRWVPNPLDVYVHENCLLVTPFDIYINQSKEDNRGEYRHGSCGCGVHECMVRSANPEYRMTFSDAYLSLDALKNKVSKIRDEYFLPKIKEIGVECDALLLHELEKDFIHYLDRMAMVVNRFSDDSIFDEFETVIFEGSQGLMLDQDNTTEFPHVTHASTGLTNLRQLLKDNAKSSEIAVYYVSRTYMTRHGAGNFTESDAYSWVKDETNQPNPWQGTMRFGDLDFDKIKEVIDKDQLLIKDIPHKNIACMTWFEMLDFEHHMLLNKYAKIMNAYSYLIAEGDTAEDCVESDYLQTVEVLE